MFFSLFLITFGVFLGQEYKHLPSVKFIFNNVMDFLKERPEAYVNVDSDTDSTATLYNEPEPEQNNNNNTCNFQ